MEKMNLNNFTYIPLLKNDAQLKKWQITTHKKKKEQSLKFIKKIKTMSQKKSRLVKKN